MHVVSHVLQLVKTHFCYPSDNFAHIGKWVCKIPIYNILINLIITKAWASCCFALLLPYSYVPMDSFQ